MKRKGRLGLVSALDLNTITGNSQECKLIYNSSQSRIIATRNVEVRFYDLVRGAESFFRRR